MRRTAGLSFAIGLAATLLLVLQFGTAAESHRRDGFESAIDGADSPSLRRTKDELPLAAATIQELMSACVDTARLAADGASQFANDGYQATYAAASEQFEAAESIGRTAVIAISLQGKQAVKGRAAAKQPLTPELETLSNKIQKVLAIFSEKHLNTAQQGPWEIMHRVVAFGIPTEIRRDGPDGERLNAIGWLLWGGRCNGQPLMVLSNGHPMGRVGPGVQGHPAQFLGMLAQSGVSAASPFQLDGKSFTVADLIEQEKLDCNSHMELTFKLIAFSYYLKSDETWTNREGQQWSISRLIREELPQPLRTGACGGTHRLFGLSSTYLYRAKRGQPIDGEFERAQTYIRDYQRYTLHTLENPDGSFSTDWFNGPANASDPARKIQTTGHILEWLVFSLPEDQLRDPRVIKSANFLATTLGENPNHDWSIGPLGHALHALAIYDKRLKTGGAGTSQDQVAKREPVQAAMAPRDRTAAPPEPSAKWPSIDRASSHAAASLRHGSSPRKLNLPKDDVPSLDSSLR